MRDREFYEIQLKALETVNSEPDHIREVVEEIRELQTDIQMKREQLQKVKAINDKLTEQCNELQKPQHEIDMEQEVIARIIHED